MRKTIIALMLVIPMCFILVIFSSVNLISLNVNVSVRGISILPVDDDIIEDTLLIDMADGKQHKVKAEVDPNDATEKGYALSSNDTTVLEVTQDGVIRPKKTGSAVITATSKDKNFTDSLNVTITSSKAYDFDFSILDSNGENVLAGDGETRIETGRYNYAMKIEPAGFGDYSLQTEGNVVADRGNKTLLFPFSGKTTITVTVPDGANGSSIVKAYKLDVKKPRSATGIIINGTADGGVVLLGKGTDETEVYVESDYEPTFEAQYALGEVRSLGGNRYVVTIKFKNFVGDEFVGNIIANGKSAKLRFSFRTYDFTIGGDNSVGVNDQGYYTSVQTGVKTTFYAVPAVALSDVGYNWQADGDIIVEPDGSGETCNVTARSDGDFVVTVAAKRKGELLAERRLLVTAMPLVNAVIISNNVKVDLAERYTLGGKRYDGDSLVDSQYRLKLFTLNASGALGKDISYLDYSVSDESVAEIKEIGGELYVVPLSDGVVSVNIEWKGNEAFGTDVEASLDLNVAKDAVEVTNAPELVRATDDGRKVVLTSDIMLGTDKDGHILPRETRATMFKRAKSTYNIEWYKTSRDSSEDNAYISYVMEFKNDVYGNGHSINADNFTHAVDGSGVPLFENYRGPLYFVKYKDMASVAGQDNCAFLIRTNGVKLYGVNLLGCSDSSLKGDGNVYDLRQLNLVGTTLEINASAEIINCRVSNGRNVIRAYGGNGDGSKYFIDSLAENRGCDDDRIYVSIKGCIISQSREFLIKIGANRALRASKKLGAQPQLVDENSRPYVPQGDSDSNNYPGLYRDEYFYRNYVLTDVTIENSVLETSGLFTVGVESNFGGEFLYEGASNHNWRQFTSEWENSGGTSFASVLRLKGDVRLYDWKDIDLIDSSSLIESPIGQLSTWLKLDIKNMIDFVHDSMPDLYGDLIQEQDGKRYVHGGIAFYGGGNNYSQFEISELDEALSDLKRFEINIGILANSSDANMKRQGELLPKAAGMSDFNFYMYESTSANNYSAQQSVANKYAGVKSVPLFDGEARQ